MKYTVTRAIQLPTGTLVKISDDLAKRHASNLAHVKGKQFECLSPMWVKAGEVIDLAAPPKHIMDALEEGGKPAKAKADAPQDEAGAPPADEDAANAASEESGPAAE